MESIEKEKTTMTPSAVTLGMTTLEKLSTLLAAQTSDQERYTLAERIIIDQITHREPLLERIKSLEQVLTATRKRVTLTSVSFSWETDWERRGLPKTVVSPIHHQMSRR